MDIRELKKSDYYLGYLDLLSQLTITHDNGYEEFCKQFDAVQNNKYHKIFVVEDTKNRKLVGTATCIVEPKFIHGFKNVGHIEDIVIDKDYRGTGYGTLLLNKAMEFGDKSNCYKVILNCTKKNVGFYKLNGFISGNYEMSFLL